MEKAHTTCERVYEATRNSARTSFPSNRHWQTHGKYCIRVSRSAVRWDPAGQRAGKEDDNVPGTTNVKICTPVASTVRKHRRARRNHNEKKFFYNCEKTSRFTAERYYVIVPSISRRLRYPFRFVRFAEGTTQ